MKTMNKLDETLSLLAQRKSINFLSHKRHLGTLYSTPPPSKYLLVLFFGCLLQVILLKFPN